MEPSIKESEVVHQGKFLQMEMLTYVDSKGVSRQYEVVRRTKATNAAMAITRVCVDGKVHVVLVRQFRPPMGRYVIEFPAGLVDFGERPAKAALRELREETGYEGASFCESRTVVNSPGLSDEQVTIVLITARSNPKEICQQEEEHIEVILAPIHNLRKWLNENVSSSDCISVKLWCYALGLEG